MAEVYNNKNQPTITHFIILNEDGSLSDPIKMQMGGSSNADEIFLSNGESLNNAMNGENTAYRATMTEISQMFNFNRQVGE